MQRRSVRLQRVKIERFLSSATIDRWVVDVQRAQAEALRRCPLGAAPVPIDLNGVLRDKRRKNGLYLPEQALQAAFSRFEKARGSGVSVSTDRLKKKRVYVVHEFDRGIVFSGTNRGGWFQCSDVWLREWKRSDQISRHHCTTALHTQITKP